MIAIIVMLSLYFSLYFISVLLITKFLIKRDKVVSESNIKLISNIIAITLTFLPIYLWTKNTTGETSDLEISNFKFEKSIKVNQPIVSDNEFHIFYSFDLTNKGETIKKFELYPEINLLNFNKMNEIKPILSSIKFVNKKNNKEIIFSEINLFQSDETIKVIGSVDLNQEQIDWLVSKKIYNEPNLRLHLDGGTSSDEFKYSGRLLNEVDDFSKLNEFIIDSYKDPKTLTLVYTQKNEFSRLKLKENPWKSKMKKIGKDDYSAIDPEDLLFYLFIN